jgi:hypothetical protein
MSLSCSVTRRTKSVRVAGSLSGSNPLSRIAAAGTWIDETEAFRHGSGSSRSSRHQRAALSLPHMPFHFPLERITRTKQRGRQAGLTSLVLWVSDVESTSRLRLMFDGVGVRACAAPGDPMSSLFSMSCGSCAAGRGRHVGAR